MKHEKKKSKILIFIQANQTNNWKKNFPRTFYLRKSFSYFFWKHKQSLGKSILFIYFEQIESLFAKKYLLNTKIWNL